MFSFAKLASTGAAALAILAALAAAPGSAAAATTAPSSSPVVAATDTLAGGYGYWEASANGAVTALAGAHSFGSALGRSTSPIVSIAATNSAEGYYELAADGAVYGYGDVHFYGSGRGRAANSFIQIAVTPDDKGYWLVSSSGQVFTYGDAHAYGSTAANAAKAHKPAPRVYGFVSMLDGKGYWEITGGAAPGLTAFGDAVGQVAGAQHPAGTVAALARAYTRGFRWAVLTDGQVWAVVVSANVPGANPTPALPKPKPVPYAVTPWDQFLSCKTVGKSVTINISVSASISVLKMGYLPTNISGHVVGAPTPANTWVVTSHSPARAENYGGYMVDVSFALAPRITFPAGQARYVISYAKFPLKLEIMGKVQPIVFHKLAIPGSKCK
ncbi:MAG: hypothetical protein M0004_01690 [Actinomycetota bacterium]|nr:hypothetical protein [Actinomycetota bacterium]